MQGTYGSGAPALTRSPNIYELELAQIAVAAGTTQITAQMITDKRADETVCGIVAGAVTQLSTGELLEQLKAGFEEWLANLKTQLSGDVAGNLQNQIDLLNTIATQTESKLEPLMARVTVLTDITVTEAVADLELNMTGNTWGNYSFVLLTLTCADGEGRSFALRVNHSETEATHADLNSTNSGKDLAYGYYTQNFMCCFFTGHNQNQGFAVLSTNGGGISYGSSPFSTKTTQTLTLWGFARMLDIKPGSRLKILGVL